MILAVDPGRDKTGVALYDSLTGKVTFQQVLPTEQFFEKLVLWQSEYSFAVLVLGDGTCSLDFYKQISQLFCEVQIELIDEAYSTLEARQLYFQLYPPKGFKKLLPVSLQSPKGPVDDLVAIILLKRYLGSMPEIDIYK